MPKLTLTISPDVHVEHWWNKTYAQISNVFDKLYNPLSVKIQSEVIHKANLTYDNIIDQYYGYETVRYTRHGVGHGTGTGINLYRAFEGVFKNKVLIIRYKTGLLAPYYSVLGSKYEDPSRQGVFDYIMNGGRSWLPWLETKSSPVTHWMALSQTVSGRFVAGNAYHVMQEAVNDLANYYNITLMNQLKSSIENDLLIIFRR